MERLPYNVKIILADRPPAKGNKALPFKDKYQDQSSLHPLRLPVALGLKADVTECMGVVA